MSRPRHVRYCHDPACAYCVARRRRYSEMAAYLDTVEIVSNGPPNDRAANIKRTRRAYLDEAWGVGFDHPCEDPACETCTARYDAMYSTGDDDDEPLTDEQQDALDLEALAAEAERGAP